MRSEVRWLSLMLLLCVGVAQATGAQGKRVGWIVPAFFHEAAGGVSEPELNRAFYPEGQSATDWNERALMSSRAITPGTTPSNVLDALAAELKPTCLGYEEKRVDVSPEDAPVLALAMWICHANSQDRGAVGTRRVVLVGDHAYIMSTHAEHPWNDNDRKAADAQLERWAQFQRTFRPCFDWTVPGCGPDASVSMLAQAVAPTAEEEREVIAAETRGLALYRQDQLAWHGTDYALAQKALDVSKRDRKGGFIAVADENGGGRVFFTSGGRKPKVKAAVAFDAQGMPSLLAAMRKLPPDVQPSYEALWVAKNTKPQTCAPQINSAVIPADDGKRWWVYVLTSTTQDGLMVLGGHTRFLIDEKRKRVLSQEPSAKSCLALDIKAGREHSKREHLRDYTPMVTHLVSHVPWETHVFQSLTFDTPLLVITDHAAWRVDGGRITKLAIP